MKVTKQDIEKLAELNATIAELSKKAEVIKVKLKAAGPGTYEGKAFKAVVAERETERLDPAVVRKLLAPAALALATKTGKSLSVSLYDL